jgi:hypothetical protein
MGDDRYGGGNGPRKVRPTTTIHSEVDKVAQKVSALEGKLVASCWA